ncbi:hypothetical protein PUN28_019816 [Cardiocondyla obscurior]|uniref:Uncharacterized protein n=1 Tax=Cardiocondyla obscurior TaxID=286306 RepID=A0AAW2EBL3_9HYME
MYGDTSRETSSRYLGYQDEPTIPLPISSDCVCLYIADLSRLGFQISPRLCHARLRDSKRRKWRTRTAPGYKMRFEQNES